jgi:hypothetical protein
VRKSLPKVNDTVTPIPEVTETTPPLPKPSTRKISAPKVGDVKNMVQFGDVEIELKPTKIKYQRDRTAAFYRILKQMPLIDILALQDGILDPERSSDKMLFDWLIAVTDDAKLVTANYDKLDSEVIHQILEIFCRLNHIPDEEKKQKAQTEKA